MTRRLTGEEAAAVMARAVPIPSGVDGRVRAPRRTLAGVGLDGCAVDVELQGPCVVVFLSTTCDGCKDLVSLVRDGAEGFEVLGVLRVPETGLPDPDVSEFCGPEGTWLLGDDTFAALDVRAAPFFCIVDADGQVAVEGVAFGRSHVEGHCADVARGEPRPDVIRFLPDAP
jgi:hypothetical protein